MAFSALWNPVFSEEANVCRLFNDAADSLMIQNRKTVSDVVKSSNALCDELARRPWVHDENFGGTDFDDLTTCCAYLKRYAACHSALARFATMRFLDNVPVHVLLKLFNRPCLKVVSVGGGPGNDVVGFLSALATRSKFFEFLNLVVIDLKKGWSEAFRYTFNLVQLKNYGATSCLLKNVLTTTAFVQSDMVDDRSLVEVGSADIILMTKVLSVIPPSKRKSVLQKVFYAMKPGAILLYIDINADMVMDTACDYPTYLLMHHPRDGFNFSIKVHPMMIRHSSFEICAIQKTFMAPMNPWTNGRYWGLNRSRGLPVIINS